MKRCLVSLVAMAAIGLTAMQAQAGFHAGALNYTNLSAGVTITNNASSSIVDVRPFLGTVKLVLVIPACGGTNTAATITPVLHTGQYNAAASNFTGTVTGTGFHAVTNGPTTFEAYIEQGTFTNSFARIDYTLGVQTNDPTGGTWTPVAYIIGFPKH